MEKYLAHKVFTPTTPAKLTFVERKAINDRLYDAIRQPGKQIVIYGYTGSGKTTLLLNKLNQLYPREPIISRCTQSNTVDKLMLDAFDQLDQYYSSEIVKKNAKNTDLKIGLDYSHIKFLITNAFTQEKTGKFQRVIPPQLTTQRLAQFLGAAECCWVIEDFHKVDESEKIELAQRIKIFMDTAAEYPLVKIIAIGAVGTAKDVINYEREMQTRVAEIQVPLMDESELGQIIAMGEGLLNIRISADVKKRIINLSNGLASVCHQLCLNMCHSKNIVETQKSPVYFAQQELKEAIGMYAEEQSDSFKSAFENAMICLEKEKQPIMASCVLRFLSRVKPKEDEGEGETFQSIFQELSFQEPHFRELRQIDKPYTSFDLEQYLAMLVSSESDEIVRYDKKRKIYFFSNLLLKVYVMMRLDRTPSQRRKRRLTPEDLITDKGTPGFFARPEEPGLLSDIDVSRLITELLQLYVEMKKSARDHEQNESVKYVIQAKVAIDAGKFAQGLQFLSMAGTWAFAIAKRMRFKELAKVITLLEE